MAVQSPYRCRFSPSRPGSASLVRVGERTAVSQPGHNRRVELFLHRLGGCGVSGQNGSSRMASRSPSQQHRAVVDNSESVTPIAKSLARRGQRCFAGRPRLCWRQTHEVLAGQFGLAFKPSAGYANGFGLNARFSSNSKDSGAKCPKCSYSPDKLISLRWCPSAKPNPAPTFTWHLPMTSKAMRSGRL